jgi:phage shock protein A
LQASWTEKAELALSKDREDLAKAALVEKQKAADMAGELGTEISVLEDALSASEEDIAKLQAKLREARVRQSSIMARMESARNRLRMREIYAGERLQDAFSRFDMLERRVDLTESRADAMTLGAPAKTLEEEIAELRSNDAVEAELAAMKAARGQEG